MVIEISYALLWSKMCKCSASPAIKKGEVWARQGIYKFIVQIDHGFWGRAGRGTKAHCSDSYFVSLSHLHFYGINNTQWQ